MCRSKNTAVQMNRLLLVLFGLMLLHPSVQAQDLLVTHAGDSINCKIISSTRDTLYFSQGDSRIQLPMAEVKVYRMNHYRFEQAKTSEQSVQEEPALKPSRFMLDFGGGYGMRIAPAPSGLSETQASHLRRLRHGHYFDANMAVFFGKRRSNGVGLTVSRFTSNAQTNNLESAGVILANAEERVQMTLVGIFGAYRGCNDKHMYCLQYGIGPLFYTDELQGSQYLFIRSTTVGVMADFSYAYRLTKHFSVGARFALVNGTVSELLATTQKERTSDTHFYKISLEKDEKEGLGHIKLGAVLRFDF